jgi:outer membrane protein TolC
MNAVLFSACALLAALPTLGAPATSSAPAAPAPELSLSDCLRIALNHNAELQIAAQQFTDARGRTIELHAILYPTANAQALLDPTEIFIQLNQVIYSRATFPQLRISRLAQDAAIANYQQTLVDVVFNVRQAFFTALGAERQLELVRTYLQGQSKALSSAQQLFEAGKIDRAAVLSVQVTGNLTVRRENTSLLSVTQARFALDNLLGQELPPQGRLVGDLDPQVPAKLDPAQLTVEALRDRADLKLLENLHLSQAQQILVDLKNAYPTVGAESDSAFQAPALPFLPSTGFDLERNYNEPEVERQAGNSQLPFSLYVSWLVLDGGNRTGIHASDQARLETQQIAIDSLRRSIPGEIAAAVSAIKAEQATLQNLDAETSPADLQHSAEVDYNAGLIRQLDLVNLESELLAVKQAHLASQVRLSLAVAALDHALGRGLQVKTTSPGAPPP